MIQLNLTLGYSFWRQIFLPYSEEYGETLNKIFKHKIVFSESIIEYYNDCANKEGNSDLCNTRIQAIIQSGKRCKIISGYDKEDKIEELVETAKNQEMKILLAEKSEIRKAKEIFLYDNKKINTNKNNNLNKYTIPYVVYVSANEDVEKYKNWLKNLFKNEKDIIIRDKYLLKDDNLNSFKKHLLPLFEKGTRISIQTDEQVLQNKLDEFDGVEYSDYQINVYKCDIMHERFIDCSDFQIIIGKGVSFLGWKWDKTSESFITLSEKLIDANSTVNSQLR